MDDESPSIESLLVSLYLYGEDLSPERISSHFGVEGTRSQRKGDITETKSGKRVAARTGMWELRSLRKSLVLSEHIFDIFSKLSTRLPPSAADSVSEIHLDVFASGMLIKAGYKHLDFELRTEDMLLLTAIGASVRVSVVD